HGHAEVFGEDVPQRQLDARDGLVRNATEILPRAAQHVPVQLLDAPRVLTEEQVLKVAHAAGDTMRVAGVAALSPPDEACIGLDARERPWSPAGVAVNRLNPSDMHVPERTRIVAALE